MALNSPVANSHYDTIRYDRRV